jgi:hypothetical protein
VDLWIAIRVDLVRYCRGELDNLLLWVELKALFAFDDLIYWKKNPEGVF